MKNLHFMIALVAMGSLASCVSKKKYTSLQGELHNTQVELAQTSTEKEALEAKFEQIENRVAEYNAKINSLRDTNVSLQEENDAKLDLTGNLLMSNNGREQLHATLQKVDPELLAGAQTMEDSVNLAIRHNLMGAISAGDSTQEDDIIIDIDKTVVMISVSDRLLFNTGSYRVNNNAHDLLERLAEVIKSEPSIEAMVEGHTDPRSISTAVVQDNWDLSVKRATSIVRKLVEDYAVAPEQLIAAGRSSFFPVVENDSPENMAKNRRTRIILIPDLDMFFALM
ncbi:MAG: OmpA family protein [Cyclobacterium sp.]|uniref:OmpA/MotB family protein n=1 Tax=unclassified Cyclobacterium TaxID=2615055 RepID=UPI0013D1D079|nr:OmpA family protein [Cyclobacterium sp. SYSU L10401]